MKRLTYKLGILNIFYEIFSDRKFHGFEKSKYFTTITKPFQVLYYQKTGHILQAESFIFMVCWFDNLSTVLKSIWIHSCLKFPIDKTV